MYFLDFTFVSVCGLSWLQPAWDRDGGGGRALSSQRGVAVSRLFDMSTWLPEPKSSVIALNQDLGTPGEGFGRCN